MKVSEREKYMIAVMPAIFVAVAYVWWVKPAVDSRLETAKKQYEAIANSPKLMEGARASDKLRDALDAATEKNREVAQRLAAVEKRWCNVPQRAATIKAVSALFAKAQLSLEKSLAEKNEEGASKISPGLRQLSRNMRELGGAEPELWRFEVRGAWSGLVAAIDGLADLEHFALPVAISTEPGADFNTLYSIVWVWI